VVQNHSGDLAGGAPDIGEADDFGPPLSVLSFNPRASIAFFLPISSFSLLIRERGRAERRRSAWKHWLRRNGSFFSWKPASGLGTFVGFYIFYILSSAVTQQVHRLAPLRNADGNDFITLNNFPLHKDSARNCLI
jgi:hypothetical protein